MSKLREIIGIRRRKSFSYLSGALLMCVGASCVGLWACKGTLGVAELDNTVALDSSLRKENEFVGVPLNRKGYFHAKCVNNSGAEVDCKVNCELRGDTKGSFLPDTAMSLDSQSGALRIAIQGGETESSFDLHCSAAGLNSVSVPVAVGTPNLNGLFRVESKMGILDGQNSIIGALVEPLRHFDNNPSGFYDILMEAIDDATGNFCFLGECVSDILNHIVGGISVNASGQSIREVTDEFLRDLGTDKVTDVIGAVARVLDGSLQRHVYVTQLNIAGAPGQPYKARHRFVKAFCTENGGETASEPVASTNLDEHTTWSPEFEVTMNPDTGRVEMSPHNMKIPFKPIIEECMNKFIEQENNGDPDLRSSLVRAACSDTAGLKHDICKGLSNLLYDELVTKPIRVAEDKAKEGNGGEIFDVTFGDATPGMKKKDGDDYELTLERLDGGKWEMRAPYVKNVPFSATREGDPLVQVLE